MKIKIKRIEESFPLPEYHTPGSVGFDLYSRQDISIPSKQLALLPSNLIIEVPEGYMLNIFPRSSTPKKGLMIANSVGVIDQDYCGPEDEIKISVYNFTENDVHVKKGQRIAQGIFVKVLKPEEWEETEIISHKNRSGFGSTG